MDAVPGHSVVYYYSIPTDSEERLGSGPKKLKKSRLGQNWGGARGADLRRIPRATPIEKTRGSTLGWPASPWPASYASVPPWRLTSEFHWRKQPGRWRVGEAPQFEVRGVNRIRLIRYKMRGWETSRLFFGLSNLLGRADGWVIVLGYWG